MSKKPEPREGARGSRERREAHGTLELQGRGGGQRRALLTPNLAASEPTSLPNAKP